MQLADAWTIHAASEQAARAGADGLARSLGRQLNAAPERLSRVLYFPRHDAKTLHLPLYDVSSRYSEAVGTTPMGSGNYTVSLGMMSKPDGSGADGCSVSYLVDFMDSSGDSMGARVKRRGGPSQLGDVEVDINANDDLLALTVVGEYHPVSLATTYPIPPSQTKLGPTYHPYFRYDMSSGFDLAQLCWEIHPVEDGPLRYTLSHTPAGDVMPSQPQIQSQSNEYMEAIYHHISLGLSLSQAYSEGVLLLPPALDPRSETIYVGSMLGILWRLRRLDGPGNKVGGKTKRLDAVKKLLKGG
ncbi:hypothetical protein BJX63DRAFT_338564 [Aspergillus granulosus]|uniref:Uncharacterized protein n=1 Tax=Aspergillus granulosus TaxID=176169 RepID=A0ABR4HZL1_9EURO